MYLKSIFLIFFPILCLAIWSYSNWNENEKERKIRKFAKYTNISTTEESKNHLDQSKPEKSAHNWIQIRSGLLVYNLCYISFDFVFLQLVFNQFSQFSFSFLTFWIIQKKNNMN